MSWFAPALAQGPIFYTRAAARSETAWSIITPVAAMLTGAVFVQGHDYLRKNPTEPRKNRILVILMLVVQSAQLAFEIFASFPSKTAVGVSDAVRLQGLHRARRAAQDSTLSFVVFLPWSMPSSYALTFCAGLLIHLFFGRIIYGMLRRPRSRLLWLAFSVIVVGSVIAGALATVVLSAKVIDKSFMDFMHDSALDPVELDIDLHVMWISAGMIYDVTLSSILISKLLTSLSTWGFDSTNEKLVSLAVSVLETLALPTIASAVICAFGIAIRARSLFDDLVLVLADIALVCLNSRFYAISLIHTLTRQAAARRELGGHGAEDFNFQDVLAKSSRHPNVAVVGKVVVTTTTTIHVDAMRKGEPTLDRRRPTAASPTRVSLADVAARGFEPLFGIDVQARQRASRTTAVEQDLIGGTA